MYNYESPIHKGPLETWPCKLSQRKQKVRYIEKIETWSENTEEEFDNCDN